MAGGGSSKAQDGGKKKARIEIIPLIDVIFFLLATFVLFTLTLNKIRSVPVNLPVASDSTPNNAEDTSVRLQVSDQGTFYWTQNKVTELVNTNEIEGRLAQYKSSLAEPRVLIAGDDKAKYGPAIFALDAVRRAGIQQVSVETRVSTTGK